MPKWNCYEGLWVMGLNLDGSGDNADCRDAIEKSHGWLKRSEVQDALSYGPQFC